MRIALGILITLASFAMPVFAVDNDPFAAEFEGARATSHRSRVMENENLNPGRLSKCGESSTQIHLRLSRHAPLLQVLVHHSRFILASPRTRST
jgi:hypothetical protein